jgi:hypothetical protein
MNGGDEEEVDKRDFKARPMPKKILTKPAELP